MGYGVYAPAKLPTVASDTDRAAAAVSSLDTLEVIGKLLYNASISPKEEKFRKIRLSNDRIRASITDVPGAVDLLLSLGWVMDPEAEDMLIIPAGKYMSMKDVRLIEDRKEVVRKEQRAAQVEAIRKPPATMPVQA